MTQPGLFKDNSKASSDVVVQRFNNGKSAIVKIDLRFSSKGNIENVTDAQIIKAVNEQLNSINKHIEF